MKSLKMNLVLTILLTASAIAMFSINANAQQLNGARRETAVQNLLNGMASDNTGLKRSSIYLAGKYQISEALPMLYNRFSQESDASTRILIGLSIYYIGTPEGLDLLKKAAAEERDNRVKNMLTEICALYSYRAGVAAL